MKFRISSFLIGDQIDELINKYPFLKDFGFHTEVVMTSEDGCSDGCCGFMYAPFIEVATLDDLMEIISNFKDEEPHGEVVVGQGYILLEEQMF